MRNILFHKYASVLSGLIFELGNKVLPNCRASCLRIRTIKKMPLPYIFQVPDRKSFQIRKFIPQISAELTQKTIAPVGGGLPLHNVSAQFPVKCQKLLINSNGCFYLNASDFIFKIGKPVFILYVSL